MLALGGLVSIVASCAPLSREQYFEPRVGMVAPVTAQQTEYNPYPTIGVAYGIEGKEKRHGRARDKTGLELSLDYFKSSGENIETDSFLLGVNATYPLKLGVRSIYLTGGLRFLGETSTIEIGPPFNVHDRQSDLKVGLDVGANFRFDARGIEDFGVRFGYTALLGSENVKGMIILAADYRF